VIMRDLRVQAPQREIGERTARQLGRVPVRGLGLRHAAAQLVDVTDALPDVARVGVECARLLEELERAIELAAASQQLALAGEDVLGTDGRRLSVRIERAAGIEDLGGRLEISEVTQDARQMEQDLDLHAAAAGALLRSGLVPAGARPGQRIDGLARPVQLLEAVAAPEETEMIGGKRGQGTVVPAQRLRPLLLALEVPTDGAVEDGGAARRQLRAAQQVAFDLVLVAEHAERTPDLVDELRGIPGFALRQVVEPAVARDDQMVLTPGREGANLGEDRVQLAHPCVPLTRPAPQPFSRCGWTLNPRTASTVSGLL